jgi:hypothetical protein
MCFYSFSQRDKDHKVFMISSGFLYVPGALPEELTL